MEETEHIIYNCIANKEQILHTGVNAGKIVDAETNLDFRAGINDSDMINPDGKSVVWASRFLGTPLKERVAGIDLMENLVAKAAQNRHKIYFFGAKEDVVAEVVKKYSELYGTEIIAGYRNGYYTENEEAEIAKNIAASGANMLFVAITSPKKEYFLHSHKETLKKVNLIMGVGGSFDVVSGKVKRAPVWMRDAGLEWFYRFAQEPRRMWKRYLVGNSKFIYLIMKERFSK